MCVTTSLAENISTRTSQTQTNSFTDLEIDSADCVEQYCYDMDFEKKQYNQLGTKSPYRRKSAEINREVVIPSKLLTENLKQKKLELHVFSL